ncbi:Slx4p interacting protein [Ceratobasidium sp. 428]|nr:Slx4p interacting protein [Ceratobasidium sp. 428]
MAMIVYGFPSKLAALQFEWVWQHPYLSRHLREPHATQTGKHSTSRLFKRDAKANLLKTKILVARTMLPMAPYNTWPLHVKIFTEEAKKLWDEVQQPGLDTPLPRGFTYSVEYEGVDGKAPIPAAPKPTTRTGPIDVKDARFTLSHIDQYQSIIDQDAPLSCSVCGKSIAEKKVDHLTIALCPHTTCSALSHLACLAQSFRGKSPSPSSPLIPRGGVCGECNKYVLWGDVIRGCYRRARGGLEKPASDQELEDESDEEGVEGSITSDEDLAERLDSVRIGGRPPTQPQTRTITSTKPAKQPKSTKQPMPKGAAPKLKPKPKVKRTLREHQSNLSSDVENFAAEMDAIQCDTEDDVSDKPSTMPLKPSNTTRTSKPKGSGNTVPKAKATKPNKDDSGLSDIERALSGLQLFPKEKGARISAFEASQAVVPPSKPPIKKAAKTATRYTKAKQAKETNSSDREQRKADCRVPPKPTSTRTAARARSPSPEYIDIWGV